MNCNTEFCLKQYGKISLNGCFTIGTNIKLHMAYAVA